MPKNFNPQHPQIWTKCLNDFLTRSPWKPCRITVIQSRGLFPKSKKGKEKRRYSLLVFWMESFRSTNRLSYWDNGLRPPCCVLPAPLPPHSPSLYLPLSRNTRHILLNTTHQPKVHFLLLSSSPSHQPYSQDMHLQLFIRPNSIGTYKQTSKSFPFL